MLTIFLGITLMIYIIMVEDEPGAVPLLLTVAGVVWFFINRYKSEKSEVLRRVPTVFLQAVVVLIGIVALLFLIIMPTREGRAANLDWISIYIDPFILYGYFVSIAFFVALYKAYQLLGYIGKNEVFSSHAVNALKSIKYCGLVLGALIVLGGIFSFVFHDKEDDAAGFVMLCLISTFISVVVATAAAIFERLLQNAVDMKAENDLTI